MEGYWSRIKFIRPVSTPDYSKLFLTISIYDQILKVNYHLALSLSVVLVPQVVGE